MPSDENKQRFDWEEDTPVPGGYYQVVNFMRDGNQEVMAVSFTRTDRAGDVPSAIEQVRDRSNEIVSVIRRRFSKHKDKETWLKLTGNGPCRFR